MTDSKEELNKNTTDDNPFFQADALDLSAPISPEPQISEEQPSVIPQSVPDFLPPVIPPEPEKKKSKAKLWIILGLVGTLLIGAVLFWFLYFDDFMAYSNAQDLLDAKKYDQAITAFTELGDFKDSKEKIKECKYEKANHLLGKGEFEQAMDIFESLGKYKKSASQVLECRYGIALKRIEQGEYEQAYTELEALNGYKNSASMLDKFVWKLSEEHGQNGTCHYSYDVKGNIVTKTYNDTVITYIYKDGLLVKEEYTGNNEQTVEYTYNTDGKKATEKRLNAEGNTEYTVTYTYDDGRLERAEKKNGKDEVVVKTNYIYNSQNLLAREIRANASDEKTYTEYTYNNQKQLTEKKVIHPDKTEEITTYTYDEKGRLAEEKFEKDDVLETKKYTYDEHRNNTKIVFTDSDGNESETENKYILIMLQ